MIELHQFPAAFGLPNASPFCMKIETFLRMHDLEYKTVNVDDPRKAPKGKCPFIIDKSESTHTTVADSSEVISYLMRTRNLDDGLSEDAMARGHLLQRTMEEHLYFCAMYERWMEPDNWKVVKDVFFAGMPAPLSAVFSKIVHSKTKRDLAGHGIGRHDNDEIYRRAGQDLQAISQSLGDNAYIVGDSPSQFDATALAFLAGVLRVPLRSTIGDEARKHQNLVNYCDRLMQQYFADFPNNAA